MPYHDIYHDIYDSNTAQGSLTAWYWPPATDPAPDRHTGALEDFAAMYGAGGQLAQLLAQAYGYSGLTPNQAMDKVRTLLADGGQPGGNTGTVSQTVAIAVAAAGTIIHPAAAGRQITVAVLAGGTTTLPGGLLDESGGALLAEDGSPILAEDGT